MGNDLTVNKRNSNIEILRLVSMLCIIIHHAVLYGDSVYQGAYCLNKYFACFFYFGGKFGSNVFFAIASYFLIKKEVKYNFIQIKKVWISTLFYTICFFMLNCVIGFKNLEIRDILETFLPISYKAYWFITAYIGILILSPILNIIINYLDSDKYKSFLILYGLMITFPATFLPRAKPYYDECHLFLCIFIYLLIGYFKKGYGSHFFENKNLVKGMLLGAILLLFSQISILFLGHKLGSSSIENNAVFWMTGESFPMLLLSMTISIYFIKKPSRSCIFVNKVSRGCLDVYLIHMNHFFYNFLWNDLFPVNHYYSLKMFPLIIFGIALIVLILGLLIGNIRICIFDKINKLKSKHTIMKKHSVNNIA